MSLHIVQVNLPDKVFHRIKRRTEFTKRSVADEVVAVVTDSFSSEAITKEVEEELAQLDVFSDDELWAAAKIFVSDDHAEKMQILLEKQSREGVSQQEEQEIEQLSRYFNRVMLVRAKAAALLKERGHHVDELLR